MPVRPLTLLMLTLGLVGGARELPAAWPWSKPSPAARRRVPLRRVSETETTRTERPLVDLLGIQEADPEEIESTEDFGGPGHSKVRDELQPTWYQDVAPLDPSTPLNARGPTPRDSGSPLLDRNPLAQQQNRAYDQRLVSQARRRAPSMIGDYFGSPDGGDDFVPGDVITPAVTVDEFSFLRSVDVVGDSAVATGRLFATEDGFTLTGVGVDENGDGVFDSFGNLVEYAPTAVGTPGVQVDSGPFVATFDGQTLVGLPGIPDVDGPARIYNIRPLIQIDIPDAGGGSAGGAVVGRIKLSENTSPIPRDRVFVNYSYFSNVNLNPGGINVNRFTPGFEKSFLDGQCSFEARFPFAATLDTTIIADGATPTDQLILGNLTATGKALIYTDDDLAVSIGLQVAMPTANDLRVFLVSGRELVRIKNESVHLMPVIGSLYTPNDQLFVQSFLQADFDANGNSVLINQTPGGLQMAGKDTAPAFIYADVAAGYWLYRNDDAVDFRVTGFAPTCELHISRSLQTTDSVRADGFQVGTPGRTLEFVSAVVGAHVVFNRNTTLTLGYTAPLTSGADRAFDGELRVMLNHYFGPTAARTAGAY